MATDPVRQVEATVFPGETTAELQRLARRLAELPPSPAEPYLTVGIDLRAYGPAAGHRLGLERFERDAEALLKKLDAHSVARLSATTDLTWIIERVGQARVGSEGMFAFACAGRNVFEAAAVPVPVPERLSLGPTPELFDLVRMIEDWPPYAVLVADQQLGVLLLVTGAGPDLRVEVGASDFPRHQHQGGWSQDRFQRRAGEREDAFARELAGQARRLVEERRIEMLVLAASEPMRTAILDALHESVSKLLVGELHHIVEHGRNYDELNPNTVIKLADPIVRRAERAREAEVARKVRDGAGPGDRSVTGPVDTLTALQTGQVMTLVLNDDASVAGWADFTLGLYGVGTVPAVHPAGGNPANLVAVNLVQEAVRLALQFDADVEVIKTDPTSEEGHGRERVVTATRPRADAAKSMDEFGGIGAVLRFTLAPDLSTARL
ncbi:MAG: host attachment protein [Thermomicrobiales bacterium]|nr:host attachment protein [Thermomicrobiales bacterium]